MAHFLLEASTPGWLGLSFAQNLGKMWPADAVIGFNDPAGSPVLNSYHIQQYAVSPSDQTNGWLNNAGYVAMNGNNKLLCFSRALDSPQAAVVKSINPTGECQWHQHQMYMQGQAVVQLRRCRDMPM